MSWRFRQTGLLSILAVVISAATWPAVALTEDELTRCLIEDLEDLSERQYSSVNLFRQALRQALALPPGIMWHSGQSRSQEIIDCTAVIESSKVRPQDRASAFYHRGRAYAFYMATDLAISDFTETVNLDPTNFKAFDERGRVYLLKEDNERAIHDFTEVIRLNPAYVPGYFNRCSAYNEKGEYDRAIVDCTEAIRLKLCEGLPHARLLHRREIASFPGVERP